VRLFVACRPNHPSSCTHNPIHLRDSLASLPASHITSSSRGIPPCLRPSPHRLPSTVERLAVKRLVFFPSGQSVRAPTNHHRISRLHHLFRETPGSSLAREADASRPRPLLTLPYSSESTPTSTQVHVHVHRHLIPANHPLQKSCSAVD
jgi:hypothetical protein